LTSQSGRRKTREQKRELVQRIKPLFDLIEQNAKAEKQAVEGATGIAYKKASPDGYRYEDRKTRETVEPEVYKANYMKYVKSVSTARRNQFAVERKNSRSDVFQPVVPEAGKSGGGCTGVGSADDVDRTDR
ncbi:unnamed protein product, partial [Sphacelaria rigidula]